MSLFLRPVLILLLVLLPLRGWAQASMTADGCAMRGEAVHALQMDGMAAAHMATMTGCHEQIASDHGASGDIDHTAHDHQHCVICHLAVAQPSAFELLVAHAAQHPCPAAANTAWHSAELQTLQRPPRT
ncbi:MAG: hypothetical protein ACOY4Y_09100 [Pseudomonadota bacterium]